MTREEAIQALKDLAEIYVRYGCDDKWIMALQMAIEALSAERVGEWIFRGTFKFSNHYPKHRYECSECHQIVHLPLTEEAYHYCPNCGARMVKESE